MQQKYSYKFPARTLGALSVCNTGWQKCGSGYSWGPGVRDHYLLHYVISGFGRFETRGETQRLAAGDLFLVRPDERIFYQADADEPWEYCWAGFRGTDAGLLLDQTDLANGGSVLRGASDEVYKLMLRIYETQGNRPHQAAYMTGALYLLLAELMRTRKTAAVRVETDSVREACTYIENHLALPISVEDIASHVGLSRSRLYRLFMEELRLSPIEVLTQARMRQACALLRRGDLNVKSVAASVGFENQLYFSRRFREIMGVSPSQYAQNPQSAKSRP